LKDALRSAVSANKAEVKGGKAIQETQANGHSVSFSGGVNSNADVDERAAAFVALYDLAVSLDTGAETNEELENLIAASLPIARRIRPDFSTGVWRGSVQ
jgi:hypothetical protein